METKRRGSKKSILEIPPREFVESVSFYLQEIGVPAVLADILVKGGEFIDGYASCYGEHSWGMGVPVFGRDDDMTIFVHLGSDHVAMLKKAKHPDVVGLK
jgi:hypothetical protein